MQQLEDSQYTTPQQADIPVDCDWPLFLLEPGLFNYVYSRSEKGEDQ